MENFFKKMFAENQSGDRDKKRDKGNYFKKFDNVDDDDDGFDLEDLFSEFHGNSLNFHGFPPTVMKQFQEILEAMQDIDVKDDPDGQRQKVFEDKFNEFRQKTDQDLDGQLYAEQLDTLLKRISPDATPKNLIAPKFTPAPRKVKISDEDKIMDIIHGTFKEEVVPVKPRRRHVQKIPASPHHFGGMPPFDLPPSSGRTWGRTVISIRKQDGSCETRKMERTADGQTKTTITKTDSDGSSSTRTFMGDEKQETIKAKATPAVIENHAERHLLMIDGYKVPCLWWSK